MSRAPGRRGRPAARLPALVARPNAGAGAGETAEGGPGGDSQAAAQVRPELPELGGIAADAAEIPFEFN